MRNHCGEQGCGARPPDDGSCICECPGCNPDGYEAGWEAGTREHKQEIANRIPEEKVLARMGRTELLALIESLR